MLELHFTKPDDIIYTADTSSELSSELIVYSFCTVDWLSSFFSVVIDVRVESERRMCVLSGIKTCIRKFTALPTELSCGLSCGLPSELTYGLPCELPCWLSYVLP